MAKLETDIQSEIIQYLESKGAYVRKIILSNHDGTLDLVVCLKGRFIAIEVKKPRGVVSPLQRYNISEIKKSDGVAFAAWNLEDVKRHLANLEINT